MCGKYQRTYLRNKQRNHEDVDLKIKSQSQYISFAGETMTDSSDLGVQILANCLGGNIPPPLPRKNVSKLAYCPALLNILNIDR